MSNDNINHPKHYTDTPFGLEVIDITEHYNFCIGNALKYIMRAGLKCEKGMTQEEKMMEDLGKAVWYLNREIHRHKKLSEKHARELAKRRKRDRERRKAKQQAKIQAQTQKETP